MQDFKGLEQVPPTSRLPLNETWPGFHALQAGNYSATQWFTLVQGA